MDRFCCEHFVSQGTPHEVTVWGTTVATKIEEVDKGISNLKVTCLISYRV